MAATNEGNANLLISTLFILHSNLDFLYGQSDEMETDFITITRSDSEEVYSLVEEMQNNSDFEKRILAYAEKLRAL